MALFLWFLIFNSHFSGTAPGLDLSLGARLNKFPMSMVPSDKIAQSKRPIRLGDSLFEDGHSAGV
jgi:hypothetical protein